MQLSRICRARAAASFVVCGLTVVTGVGNICLAAAMAPLDPNAFPVTSINDLAGSGAFAFDTGNGSATPTLTVGSHTYQGTISNGVAVFDFNNIGLSTTATVTATGSLPLALLSRLGATVECSVTVGAGGYASGGGPGGADGSRGAGYGGAGGVPGNNQGGGGNTYGDFTHVFQGGSGGGAGSTISGGNIVSLAGGAGGGAIEISTLQDIIIGDGTASEGIFVNGSGGKNSGNLGGSGGGSGGGIFLASSRNVVLRSTLEAIGGVGGQGVAFDGGSGGGGRILVESGLGFYEDSIGTLPPTVSVLGGGIPTNGSSTEIGDAGSFAAVDYVPPIPVPEPTGLALLGFAFSPLLRRSRR